VNLPAAPASHPPGSSGAFPSLSPASCVAGPHSAPRRASPSGTVASSRHTDSHQRPVPGPTSRLSVPSPLTDPRLLSGSVRVQYCSERGTRMRPGPVRRRTGRLAPGPARPPGPSGRRPRPGGGPAGVPPPTVGNLAALVPGSQPGSDSESALGSGPTGMPLRRCERFVAAAPGAIRVLRDPLIFRVVSAYASPSPCFRFCSLFFSALLGLRLPLELEPTSVTGSESVTVTVADSPAGPRRGRQVRRRQNGFPDPPIRLVDSSAPRCPPMARAGPPLGRPDCSTEVRVTTQWGQNRRRQKQIINK
jgi:hypothetical protein